VLHVRLLLNDNEQLCERAERLLGCWCAHIPWFRYEHNWTGRGRRVFLVFYCRKRRCWQCHHAHVVPAAVRCDAAGVDDHVLRHVPRRCASAHFADTIPDAEPLIDPEPEPNTEPFRHHNAKFDADRKPDADLESNAKSLYDTNTDANAQPVRHNNAESIAEPLCNVDNDGQSITNTFTERHNHADRHSFACANWQRHCDAFSKQLAYPNLFHYAGRNSQLDGNCVIAFNRQSDAERFSHAKRDDDSD
jgi:hypothetical protein